MCSQKNLKKFIATAVIIAFVFQGDIFLRSQTKDEIVSQFERSKEAYIDGQYDSSIKRLERTIGTIKRKKQERKNILGKCYLLLGAIYEKKGKIILAEENYRRAKELGIESIEDVDFNSLPIYKRVVIGEIGIETQFQKAVDEYNNNQNDSSKIRLERLIGTMKEKGLEVEKKDILGKCYHLLGAIYEKKGETILAEENYRNAKKLGIESIESVNLEELPIYKRAIKGIFEKEGHKKKKKKFPWLLVSGGVVVVVIAVIFLLKKKTYKLSVTKDEGVEGEPASGIHLYKKGKVVDYNYTSSIGYNNLVVRVDDNIVEPHGKIVMDMAHILTATTTANVVTFVTDKNELEITEGNETTFNIKLSSQPSKNVNVTVTIESSRDVNIRVESNSSSFTFSPTDWNNDRTVTLYADEDQGTNHGEAKIRISAPEIPFKDIHVVEQDNDELKFITNTEIVIIDEGRAATFDVSLSNNPLSTVNANVSRIEGSTDISIKEGKELIFNEDNWYIPQTVKLKSERDLNTSNDTAKILISANRVKEKEINVYELDSTDSWLSIKIKSPSNNAVVISNIITIDTFVSSSKGIDRVDFFVDGHFIKKDSESPDYSADWNTADYSNGYHDIKTIIYNNEGESAEDQITVKIER